MTAGSISILIPTLNSGRVLEPCLESIVQQDYPRDLVEIIIADGGSTDDTLEIARKYTDRIYLNELKTGEAGKAVALRHARNEIVVLIDSDNVLPSSDWLSRMTEPFADGQIVAAEPVEYTLRREDGYITRYCALLGMNDPLCLFLGNYDRYSQLARKWTDIGVAQEDKGPYIKVTLRDSGLPTMGANGFMVRRAALRKCSVEEYFFDIDVVYELVKQGHNKFAKVKIGIVHLFASSLSTFASKQRRRIRDYAYYQRLGVRKYPWSCQSKAKLLKFVIYTILTWPLVFQAAKGYLRVRDNAWLFHIPACWTTLLVYALGTLQSLLRLRSEEDRSAWIGQR